MNIQFIMTALFAISLITNLTVEAIKKLLEGTTIKYSKNLLTVIVCVLISIIGFILYILNNDIAFDIHVATTMIILTYLSFLVATNGYDKVHEIIKQFTSKKGENNE